MKKIWEEIQKDLTREKILSNARKNREKPFGYVFDYIRDVYPYLNRVPRSELAVALCTKLGIQIFAETRLVLMFKGYDYGDVADYVIDPVTKTTMLVPTGMQLSPVSGEALIWADEDMKEIPVDVARYSMGIAEVYPYKVVAKTRAEEDDMFLNILPEEDGGYYVGVCEDADLLKEKRMFWVHSGADNDVPDCDCTNYEEVIKFALKFVLDNIIF